jgi:hypothetical protein
MPRELIDTNKDKRFVRRDERGRFKDVVDVGKSLAQDRRHQAKTTVKPGEGDRGDQRRKGESGRIGYLVLYLMGAPIGLLLILWLVLGNNIFGPG